MIQYEVYISSIDEEFGNLPIVDADFPIEMDGEETFLADKMKTSARHKIPTLTRWYIDQLAEHITEKESVNVS